MIIKKYIENIRSQKRKQEEIINLKKYIEYTNNLYRNELDKDVDTLLNDFYTKIKKRKYKGIVIYPVAINWNPVQRPHHLLRKLGEKGYLCFFCIDDQKPDLKVIQKFKNVFLINKQEKLLPLLRGEKVNILVTYFLQYLYADFYQNKVVWLDVLDRLDFMSLYNSYSKKLWNKLIKNANIVTYSADNLKEYLTKRRDAFLLENGVNIEDFQNVSKTIPKDLKEIIKRGKKIIGYYGAIENWFDFELLKKIDNDDYSIVIIGKVNQDLQIKKYKNVFFLGQKDYNELVNYAKYFDIAMIPFIINEITNSVSPVKFFEYMALSKPVISTNIKEMQKYKCNIVKIVNNNNINESIEQLLELDKDTIERESKIIAYENTWEKRIEKVISYI